MEPDGGIGSGNNTRLSFHNASTGQEGEGLLVVPRPSNDRRSFSIRGNDVDGLEVDMLYTYTNPTGTPDAANYVGKIDSPKNLVNKGYVDDNVGTYSLTSGPESYRKKGNVVLGDKEFGVVASGVGSTNVVFLNKLYLNDAEGVQLVKDYEATNDSWFEVYKNGALILRMQIKKSSWQPSGTDANQIQFNGVYTYPLVGLSENWSGTTNYKIALTGLRKI